MSKVYDPKSAHIQIGKKGELLASKFLQKEAYTILETNWRFSKAEIDIICQKDEMLIFIEVKTRSSINMGRPEEFVTKKKEYLMLDAANRFMEQHGYNWEIRFDIIAIHIPSEHQYSLEHFKDVFH